MFVCPGFYSIMRGVCVVDVHLFPRLRVIQTLCRKILRDSSANDFSMWSSHAALKTGARPILNFWDADVDTGKWKIPLSRLPCIHFLQRSLRCLYQTFVTKIYNEGRKCYSLTINFIVQNDISAPTWFTTLCQECKNYELLVMHNKYMKNMANLYEQLNTRIIINYSW